MEHALGALELLIRAVEPVDLRRLAGKGAGGADAGERGFDIRIDLGRFLLLAAGRLAHPAAARHGDGDKDGQNAEYHQRKPPFHRKHHGERAQDRQARDQQILRSVMGKFGQLKEVACQPAHELTGAVMVKKADVQLLHVDKKIAADVRLHADAEGVPPVGDDIVQHRAQRVCRKHQPHNEEKRAVLLLRQKIVHCLARDQRKGKVNERDDQRAGHIQRKKLPVRLKIGKKNRQGFLFLQFFCGHIMRSF